MTPDEVGPKDLAALLDGSLSGEKRTVVIRAIARSPELLRQLVRAEEQREIEGGLHEWPGFERFDQAVQQLEPGSPEWTGAFEEAARAFEAAWQAGHVAAMERDDEKIGRELQGAVAASQTVEDTEDVRILRFPRRWWPYVTAAAAVIALLLALPMRRSEEGRAYGYPVGLAEEIFGRAEAALVPIGRAIDNPGWAVQRGVTTGLAPQPAAFRLGVRILELGVAVGFRDSLRVLAVTADMQRLLHALPLSDAAAVTVQTIADRALAGGGLEDVSPLIAAADEELEQLLDVDQYRAGVWWGAARLAAAARDSVFFNQSGFITVPHGAPAAALWVDSVTLLVRGGVTQAEFPELERLISLIVADLGD